MRRDGLARLARALRSVYRGPGEIDRFDLDDARDVALALTRERLRESERGGAGNPGAGASMPFRPEDRTPAPPRGSTGNGGMQ